MGFPHEKRESLTHGRSPGNGITPKALSRNPLATEGEATPGPDDYNPYEEREAQRERESMTLEDEPTAGDDPFVFDDLGESIGELEFPEIGKGPQFEF